MVSLGSWMCVLNPSDDVGGWGWFPVNWFNKEGSGLWGTQGWCWALGWPSENLTRICVMPHSPKPQPTNSRKVFLICWWIWLRSLVPAPTSPSLPWLIKVPSPLNGRYFGGAKIALQVWLSNALWRLNTQAFTENNSENYLLRFFIKWNLNECFYKIWGLYIGSHPTLTAIMP